MANSDKNNDFPVSTIGCTRRLLWQIPLPSTGLTLRQSYGSNVTIAPVRKRRTVSEQVNRHDR